MKARKALLLAPAAALLPLAFASPAAAADGTWTIKLNAINNSGATGTAVVMLEGTSMHVTIDSKGLVPNAPHAQHVHGDTTGKTFKCPTPGQEASLDKDGNGVVSTTEAVSLYGGVMIALTTSGATDAASSALAVDRFPKADANGDLHYERTITVTEAQAEALKHLHIVQHGIDGNGNGQYDGAAKSDLDPSLPAEATDPANCGMLSTAQMTSMPMGGVETGGTAGGDAASLPLYLLGAGTLAASGAMVLSARRSRRVTVGA